MIMYRRCLIWESLVVHTKCHDGQEQRHASSISHSRVDPLVSCYRRLCVNAEQSLLRQLESETYQVHRPLRKLKF
jgi:hypothetical protein